MTRVARIRLSLMAWCISILFSALLGIAALSAANHPQHHSSHTYSQENVNH